MIGFIAEKYESGNAGPATISGNPLDPGGISYGCYQLSSTAGTLGDFIAFSLFTDRLSVEQINSFEFKKVWRDIAFGFPSEFKLDQYGFILRQLYLPAAFIAKYNSFSTEAPAVQEAIFSIAVQHGHYHTVIFNAKNWTDERTQITELYRSRREYVKQLTLPVSLERTLMRRYDAEEADVLDLL